MSNNELFAFTALDKRREAMREVAMRKRVYERRIQDGRMSATEADRLIAIMQAIADDYHRQEQSGRQK